MSREDDFKKYATEYDPIKVGSIDGTDSEPHDRAILRALRSQYTLKKLVKGDAVNTLFVGRLNPRTTEETLKAEFGKYGRILNCRLVKDIVTGKSKQYAFIEFENLGSVDQALKEMQKEYIDSAEIIVEREAERRLVGWRPRRLGGGFGGRKESGQLRFGCQDRPFRKPIMVSITSQRHGQTRQIMCYVCCKELKGWCKSFTRTEGLLAILQAILLGVLISFLVFLILHFLACHTCPEPAPEKDSERDIEELHFLACGTCPEPTPENDSEKDIQEQLPISPAAPAIISAVAPSTTHYSTLPPDVECTWEPSQPTTARTRYYLSDRRSSPGDTGSTTTKYSKGPSATTESLESVEPSLEYDDVEFLEQSDGVPAEDTYKNQVVALVKLKPPGDVTFGCILTKITKFWTLTAASCIESIEEVDSLDSFVIMEDFGSAGASRPRTVADVRLHPRYATAARAHDLAALRADRPLRARSPPLRLPRLLDYFLVALGERFHILGYGGYRTVDRSAETRQLRQVSVFVVASAACAADERAEQWAPRHLLRGQAARHGACGAAPLCAGARFSRGAPCNYCAGAPLLRDHTLFGVMSDNSACGVACEPQLYVNIATLRDWIDSVIE